jgi:hypothetical protein
MVLLSIVSRERHILHVTWMPLTGKDKSIMFIPSEFATALVTRTDDYRWTHENYRPHYVMRTEALHCAHDGRHRRWLTAGCE